MSKYFQGEVLTLDTPAKKTGRVYPLKEIKENIARFNREKANKTLQMYGQYWVNTNQVETPCEKRVL